MIDIPGLEIERRADGTMIVTKAQDDQGDDDVNDGPRFVPDENQDTTNET